MIGSERLLTDLQKLLKHLEDDIRRRYDADAELDRPLREQHAAAREAGRTAQAYEVWRDEQVTQAAVAWILSCVFIRFCEDNRLFDPASPVGAVLAYLSGPGDRRKRAEDEHALYFQRHPTHSDRDYLLWVFDEVAKLPAMKELLDHKHNPLWAVQVSGDGAMALRDFFLRRDPASGVLVHDFTDPAFVPDATGTAEASDGGGDPTRFLGDLYQDLSESARKKYALLQTPIFVEEFILDRTLEPAIREFGFQEVRMIDPTCGSGHFLLGGFRRLFDRWVKHEPTTLVRELAQRALNGVYGVDLNPYAVAIARFRLLVAALRACDVGRLKDAPGFTIHLAAGDSLLHGPALNDRTADDKGTRGRQAYLFGDDPIGHVYDTEDAGLLRKYLGQQYHAVVGNPPYVTVKDKATNDAYRDRFAACHRKYSLSVPFFQRFFDLALSGTNGDAGVGGFVGQITSNSFMKREFGKKLIEDFLPRWDLSHVIDTSGAYVPGHGTPTVILFGRNRPPTSSTIRAVMGIRGEPSTPADPATGLVWSAILAQTDVPGSTSDFVSVTDAPRANFHRHPWSIGGGGAAELKEVLDEGAETKLGGSADSIGISSVTGEDDLYLLPGYIAAHRLGVEQCRPFVVGDIVRDWSVADPEVAIWLYDQRLALMPLESLPVTRRLMWSYRAAISRRKRFGTPMLEKGLTWYEWQELYADKLRTPLSIVFGFVATHNHFVLDRGGKVFNRSAPVIKLPADASDDEHLGLLGILNSSVACFWMKQVFQNKGSTVDQHGARQRTAPFEDFHEFTGTGLQQFPLPAGRPLDLARELDGLARAYAGLLPGAKGGRAAGGSAADPGGASDGAGGASGGADGVPDGAVAASAGAGGTSVRTGAASAGAVEAFHRAGAGSDGTVGASPRAVGGFPRAVEASHRAVAAAADAVETSGKPLPFQDLDANRARADELAARQVALQEELDWECYRLYGLLGESPRHASPPPVRLGQRAFEIVLARRMAAGEVETTWFERHGSTAITEIPAGWPADYQAVVRRRIEIIEKDANAGGVGLIERPEFKRRWNTEAWADMQERALREWLLDRLEGWPLDGDGEERRSEVWDEAEPRLMSVAQLADRVRQDKAGFMRVAALYRGREDFDVTKLVAELVADEAVPFLPVLRYKESGLRNRKVWEQVWDLQREEDRLEALRAAERQNIDKAEKRIRLGLKPQQDELNQLQARVDAGRETLKTKWLADERFDLSVKPEELATHLKRDVDSECRRCIDEVTAVLGEAKLKQKAMNDEFLRRRGEDAEYLAAVDRLMKIPPNPDVPVPPKYKSADMLPGPTWRLRGKLDVPKERFVSFPNCERDGDPTLVITWAGFDHLQQMRALDAYLTDAKENQGWPAERRAPLLTGMLELLPWVLQWHNEIDPEHQLRMGDFYRDTIIEEAKKVGMTLEQVRAWTPAAKPTKAGRKQKASAGVNDE